MEEVKITTDGQCNHFCTIADKAKLIRSPNYGPKKSSMGRRRRRRRFHWNTRNFRMNKKLIRQLLRECHRYATRITICRPCSSSWCHCCCCWMIEWVVLVNSSTRDDGDGLKQISANTFFKRNTCIFNYPTRPVATRDSQFVGAKLFLAYRGWTHSLSHSPTQPRIVLLINDQQCCYYRTNRRVTVVAHPSVRRPPNSTLKLQKAS